MLERALTSLQMMVHRSGSVDGEGDGSGLHGRPAPAARGAGGWSARALDAGGGRRPALHGRPHLLRQHRGRRGPGAAHRGDRRRARLRGALERRGDGRPRRARAARRRDPARLLAARLPRRARPAPRRPPPATGRWCRSSASSTATSPRSRPTTPSTRCRASRRCIPRFYPEMPSPTSPSSRIIAHNRYSTNTLPHVQPRAAVLDPGPQRRDQHDRPAARAERAARPAHHARRLGQPGPQPPARGPDLREGPLAARGRRVRAAADPRRGAPPAREAPGPLRALPRGARAPTPRARSRWPAGRGDEMVFAVDAMGLRPLWWIETEDIYVVSSEPGIVPVAELTRDPAPLAPGEKVALITGEDGAPRVLDYWEVQREVYRARQEPRRAAPRRDARPPGRRPRAGGRRGVLGRRRRARGARAASSRPSSPRPAGSRATSSSSSSTPTAAPSRSARSAGTARSGPFTPVPMPLSDYLQETVAVVTNPAIDREREVEHFSTRVVLGRRPPIEGVEPEPPQRCELRMPLILGGMRPGASTVSLPELRRVAVGQGVACMEDVLAAWDWRAVRLPLLVRPRPAASRAHLAQLAEAAPRRRARGRRADRAARPQAPARTSGSATRTWPSPPSTRRCARRARRTARPCAATRSLVLQAGRHPQRARRDGRPGLRRPGAVPLRDAREGDGRLARARRRPRRNVLEGLQKGMEKVLSTLGIHELRGYGRLVSAIGVAPEVLDILAIPGFCASDGRGLDLDDLDALAEQGRADPRRRGAARPRSSCRACTPRSGRRSRGWPTPSAATRSSPRRSTRLETEQPVALRHAVAAAAGAATDERIPAERTSARASASTPCPS